MQRRCALIHNQAGDSCRMASLPAEVYPGKANAMNDPHVVALFYKVGHAEHIDYNKAPPLIHAQAEFEVRIERDHAVVRMREHYATIESGRAVIEPFFRAWELGAALRRGLGELEFKYDRAEVID